MKAPQQPTSEQCSARARLPDWEGQPAFACWYPQMGGYVGRAVVVVPPDGNGTKNTYDFCFEVFVWHDGEFPFDDNNDWRGPVRCLHHCMPSQFVDFGQFVINKQQELYCVPEVEGEELPKAPEGNAGV